MYIDSGIYTTISKPKPSHWEHYNLGSLNHDFVIEMSPIRLQFTGANTSHFQLWTNFSISHLHAPPNGDHANWIISQERSHVSTNFQKPKPSKPSKQPQTCSLGHPGHSDERCYTQILKEERELANKYREMMKKNSESASLTIARTTPSSTSSSVKAPVTSSYYDEAYAVGLQDLLVVTLDTTCTSHMFGSQILLQNLKWIPPSWIQVASKTGDIYTYGRGLAHLDKLQLGKVIYSPELLENLISAGILYGEGYDIRWNVDTAKVISLGGSTLLTFHRDASNSRLWQI